MSCSIVSSTVRKLIQRTIFLSTLLSIVLATTVQSIFSNLDAIQNPVPLKLNYDTLDAGGHHVPNISDQELNAMSISHVKGHDSSQTAVTIAVFPEL